MPIDRRFRAAASPGDRATADVDFTELRAALLEIDRDFGGLRPRQPPENRGIVYLCRSHREALRYPQQTSEPDL